MSRTYKPIEIPYENMLATSNFMLDDMEFGTLHKRLQTINNKY